jgi:hypothetical protein
MPRDHLGSTRDKGKHLRLQMNINCSKCSICSLLQDVLWGAFLPSLSGVQPPRPPCIDATQVSALSGRSCDAHCGIAYFFVAVAFFMLQLLLA